MEHGTRATHSRKADSTATKNLYQHLKQDIVTCVLQPGQPLSECELANRYQTSRTPVREACRHLANEGFITIIPFRGYFVAPLTMAEFKNLQEVQLIVDPAAAELAAERAGSEQLSQLERWARYKYRRGHTESYYEFLDQNRKLHTGIAEATGNRRLVEIVFNLHTRLMRYFFLGLDADSFGGEIATEHCAIVDAIRRRNGTEAHDLARRHILSTMRRSSSLFTSGTPGIEMGLWTATNGLSSVPSSALALEPKENPKQRSRPRKASIREANRR